jgi:hypothetical protein
VQCKVSKVAPEDHREDKEDAEDIIEASLALVEKPGKFLTQLYLLKAKNQQ